MSRGESSFCYPEHIALARLDEAAFLDAMVRSFYGDETPLVAQVLALQSG